MTMVLIALLLLACGGLVLIFAPGLFTPPREEARDLMLVIADAGIPEVADHLISSLEQGGYLVLTAQPTNYQDPSKSRQRRPKPGRK
jgi:hypothetical protein